MSEEPFDFDVWRWRPSAIDRLAALTDPVIAEKIDRHEKQLKTMLGHLMEAQHAVFEATKRGTTNWVRCSPEIAGELGLTGQEESA